MYGEPQLFYGWLYMFDLSFHLRIGKFRLSTALLLVAVPEYILQPASDSVIIFNPQTILYSNGINSYTFQ